MNIRILIEAILNALLFLMKDDEVRDFAVGKVKGFITDERQKHKTIDAIVEEVEDKDLQKVMVTSAKYLSKKTSNTYDDQVVRLIESQGVN